MKFNSLEELIPVLFRNTDLVYSSSLNDADFSAERYEDNIHIYEGREYFRIERNTLIMKGDSNGHVFRFMKFLKQATFIRKIKLGEGVRSIADNAFYNCTTIVSVECNEELELLGMGVFDECKNLKEVKLSKSLKEISPVVFRNCQSLRKIEGLESVTRLSGGAFQNCNSLKELHLPSVVSLGREVFYGCSSLKELHLPSVVSLEGIVFGCCDALELLEVSKDLTLSSFSTIICGVPSFANIVFHGTGLSLIAKECRSLLEKARSLEEKPETVYEALRLFYLEEIVVSGYETNTTTEEVEETSLF